MTDTIALHDAHRPELRDGDYRVRVSQRLLATGVDHAAAPEDPVAFSVAGPRCALNPAEIGSVFPPDTARGVFTHVLPQVVLRRATLPWERTADVRPDDHGGPGWLALVVLSDDEAHRAPVVHVPAAEALRRTGQAPEAADDPDEAAAVLSLPPDVAAVALPGRTELALLAHVRSTGDRESAVITAHRFPAPGRYNAVHLVSLEGRFAPGQERIATDTGPVQVVSLASWRVFCVADPEIDFSTLASRLAPASVLRLPTDGVTDAVARSYAEVGFVPLTHRFRSGDTGASWYHGPLLPGPSPLPAGSRSPAAVLPVRSADELLLRDAGLGMLDCSYAAAWELGRLLVLARPRVATDLYAWKRAHRRRALAQAAPSYLPLGTRPTPEPDFSGVTGFFGTDLGLLAAVPFDHLVPDPAMLPPGSLRFFTVDTAWIECLVDGAFAIGRSTGDEHEADAARRDVLAEVPAMSGVLVRSPLVSGWPSMLVDGYAGGPDALGEPLEVLRVDRPGPDVLLVLFRGEVRTLDLHCHPEEMHAGFADDRPPPADADRALDLAAVRRALGDGATAGPAALARALLTGVPLVRLQRPGRTAS